MADAFWMASDLHLPFCLWFLPFVLPMAKVCFVTGLLPTSNMVIDGRKTLQSVANRPFYRLCPRRLCVHLWFRPVEHQALHLFKGAAGVTATHPSSEFSGDKSGNGKDRLADCFQPVPNFSFFKMGLEMGMYTFAGWYRKVTAVPHLEKPKSFQYEPSF